MQYGKRRLLRGDVNALGFEPQRDSDYDRALSLVQGPDRNPAHLRTARARTVSDAVVQAVQRRAWSVL